jgi:hypothetical protein
MGIKLSPNQNALYKAIDEILWNDWDPIGVKSFGDWPKDEYQSYTPTIFSLKNKNASVRTIALALYEIETERMGVTGSFKKCMMVADRIYNLDFNTKAIKSGPKLKMQIIAVPFMGRLTNKYNWL